MNSRKSQMIKNPHTRRVFAAIIVVLGAAVMLLAPEAWPGILLLILGVALELFGIVLEHKTK
jgi:drug/metabolite transporter (DMT)-like permease